MPRYYGCARTFLDSVTFPVAEIYTPTAGMRPRIMELGVFAAYPSTGAIWYQYTATPGVGQIDPTSLTPGDPNDPESITKICVKGWQTMPQAYNGAYLARISTIGTYGNGFLSIYPRGLAIFPTRSLMFKIRYASYLYDINVTVEE